MNESLARTIGDAARAARTRLGLTQVQVAELVGIAAIVAALGAHSAGAGLTQRKPILGLRSGGRVQLR